MYLPFRAEDAVGTRGGTSRIGPAESRDGLHFEADPLPVVEVGGERAVSIREGRFDSGLVEPGPPALVLRQRYGVASAFSTSAMVIIMVIGSSGDSWNPARW